jgi:ketosteroid isomerase-like protein
MKIADAAELHTTWAARFNAKDLDGMVALAETDSVFVPQPGAVVAGEAAVRSAEQQFLNIGLPITLNVRRVIISGDIALLISDWTLTGTAADGSEVNMSGTTADVARRGRDGWKYVIDNPFGTI